MTDQFGRPYDLDQSGRGFHKARSYLGPSLGWVETQILPERKINAAGTYQIEPGDSVVLLEAGLPSTFLLPDVKAWQAQNATQPATGFTRGIWIKDYAGNSLTVLVTLVPFGQQTIDGLNQNFILAQNFGLIALFPLVDGTGWWLAPMTYDTGTGGTTAINPTPPITGNVVGNVMNVGFNFDSTMFRVNAGQFAFEQISPGCVLGNPTNVLAPPFSAHLSLMLDRAIGSTQGQIMIRDNNGWTFLNPGTVNQVLNSGGPGSNPFWGLPLQGSFLPITGGTLTGNLIISSSTPAMLFDFAEGTAAVLASRAQLSGNFRWQFIIADGSPETGSNIGSNFRIDRYADDGSFLGTPISISRHDGQVIIRNGVFIGTPSITLQFNPGTPAVIASQTVTGGFARWLLALGDGTAETGSNAGSNFGFNRYDDSGNFLGSVMTANRATGEVFIPGLQNYQPRDADLTALSGLTGTNTIYYRSGADMWSPVAIGANLAFTGGVLSAASGGGGALVVGASTVSNGVTGRILFNSGGILGEYDAANATGFLNLFTASLKGLVPLSGGGTVNYLRADGTWSPPPGSGGIAEPVGDGFWGRNMLSGLGTWEQTIKKAGDIMTGDLTISKAAAALKLDNPSGGSDIFFRRSGLDRWDVGVGGPEGGSNSGSDFAIWGATDAGTYPRANADLMINRATGQVNLSQSLFTNAIVVGGNGTFPEPAATFKMQVVNALVRHGTWSADAVGSNITYAKSRSATQGAHTIVQNGDRLGTVQFAGSDGSVFVTGAQIQGNVDGSPVAGNVPGMLNFLTRQAGGALSTRMTLTNAGTLMIGPSSSSPAGVTRLFQVDDTTGNAAIHVGRWQAVAGGPTVELRKSRGAAVGTRAAVLSGDTLGELKFYGDDGTNFVNGAAVQAVAEAAPAAGFVDTSLRFLTFKTGLGYTEKIRIYPSGGLVTPPTIADPGYGCIGASAFNVKQAADSLGQGFQIANAANDAATYMLICGGSNPNDPRNFGVVTNYPGTGFVVYNVGDFTNAIARLVPTGCQLKGTNTNDNAATGYIGEIVQALVSEASPQVVNAVTPTNHQTLNLTAGDWDVRVTGAVKNAGATANIAQFSISLVSNTMDTSVGGNSITVQTQAVSGFTTAFAMNRRVSISATTPVYLVGQISSGGTWCGSFIARRRR